MRETENKNIAVLGSTGSVGEQALDVAARLNFTVSAISAARNVRRLEEQARRFHVRCAAMADESAAKELKLRLADTDTEIFAGADGICEMIAREKRDVAVNSIIGKDGLLPTLAVIDSGARLALANKESLVVAGEIVTRRAKERGVEILPVDSEHSAIFQSLRGGTEKEVKRLIITASGGPFRGKKRSELENVTLAQCLNHPNWSMGQKVTLDSSTLANKGLEVMEAHWLFDMPYDKIAVVVHPQSIVHSLVEFCDGSVIAQLGVPDMRLPIQFALSWPERYDYSFEQLDLVAAGNLTFEAPDLEAFPSLKIAIDCGKAGGTLPCAFNAANEEAVYAFLAGKIKYLDIPYITATVTAQHNNVLRPQLEDIEATDAWARAAAKGVIAKL